MIHIWIVSSFWLLPIKLLKHLYTSLWVILLDKCLGIDCVEHIIGAYLTFLKQLNFIGVTIFKDSIVRLFSRVVVLFHIPALY